MTSTDDDEKIRELAYQLWEQAGRPADREDEFWHQARAQIPQPPEPPKTDQVPISETAKSKK